MPRKCTRCFVPLKKAGTFYISPEKGSTATTPIFMWECPNCSNIEFTKVKES